jgi:hypothetical protein
MHRALLVDDIVKAILVALPSHDERIRDLAALARSCRVLSEPALDMLWESVSVWQVAQTMTEECWHIEKNLRTITAEGEGHAEDASESSEEEEVWTLVRTTPRSYRQCYNKNDRA